MRLLQVIFGIFWVLGYAGNGLLFLYVYWGLTQHNFLQLFNPFFHFQVLGVLLTTPLFWLFLAMAVVGYYAATWIDQYLERQRKQNRETTSTKIPQRSQTLPEAQYNPSSAPIVLEAEPPYPPNTAVGDISIQAEERPFIRCRTNELEGIAEAEWNNAKVLNALYYELEFRSRQRAYNLQQRISVRLAELGNSRFTWSTTSANSGSQNLSSDAFKYEEGLLKQYGYRVGRNGLSQYERWEILDTIFLRPLTQIDDPAYLSEWGEPKSAKRLKKLADSIAAFARNARRRNTDNFSKAIQDWETDLEYLKKTYYTSRFSFQYPRIN